MGEDGGESPEKHVFSTEGGAFAAAAERTLYFVFVLAVAGYPNRDVAIPCRFGKRLNTGVSPLRFAPVEMTCFRLVKRTSVSAKY